MAEEVKQFGYVFPYLFDETQEVAKAYHAACTPDIYLFDRNGIAGLSRAVRWQPAWQWNSRDGSGSCEPRWIRFWRGSRCPPIRQPASAATSSGGAETNRSYAEAE